MATTRYKGVEHFALRLPEGEKQKLQDLINSYDPLLSVNSAITKLVHWAIQEHFMPGYTQVEKPKGRKTVEEVTENALDGKK